MGTLAQDCKEMHALFEQATALDKEAKAVRAEAKELEAKLLDRMEQEETDSIASGGTLYTKAQTIFAAVQDESAFQEWATTHDEQLIEAKVKKDLLNQLVRERLDNGEELPPGVGFYPKDYISKKAR